MTAPLLWSRGEPGSEWGSLEYRPEPGSPALQRLWRGFMTARSFVGVVLMLLQGVSFGLTQTLHPFALALSASYLVTALLGARYVRFRPPIRGFGPAWLASIGVDLATFTLLQVLQAGNINYTPLFALPVLMGAVLGTAAVGLG
ncbi:MAG: PAS domain-containing sensor histidine kinase, partial [Comamonadaceae bacterium]